MNKLNSKCLGIIIFLFFGIISISIYYFKVNNKNNINTINTTKISYTIKTPKDISEVITDIVYEKKKNSQVEPSKKTLFVYDSSHLDLRDLETAKKKKIFTNLLLPTIYVVKQEFLLSKKNISIILKKLSLNKELTDNEKTYLELIKKKYKAKSNSELTKKMVFPPISLILAQASLESGWGTSRFFRDGNNIFGVWSYNKNEPRIKAKQIRANGYTAYLKKYASLKGSVEDYILLISKQPAYKNLRAGILKKEDSTILAKYLINYSELKKEYIRRVRLVIRSNNLTKYDNNNFYNNK